MKETYSESQKKLYTMDKILTINKLNFLLKEISKFFVFFLFKFKKLAIKQF